MAFYIASIFDAADAADALRDASCEVPRYDVMRGFVKIPFSSINFLAFIVKKGIPFFIKMGNVDEIPLHFRGDFHRLYNYFHDIGNKLSAHNSQIQFELHQARSNAASLDIIIELEQQLVQVQNDWTKALHEGWMNDEFYLFKF